MPALPRLLAALALIACAVLTLAPPAHAHQGVRPTLHHDGHGSVWVTVTWDDGHPIDAPSIATMSATSGTGDAVPVAPLRALPHDPATLAYAATLPSGRWSVTVDIAAPGVGFCTATLAVGPAAPAQTHDCAPPPAAAPPVAASGPAVPLTVLATATVLAALAITALAVTTRSRRRR
ncbi:hypothetical protein F4553_007458 [Allocatelliglobosispora scoriae]|uniref:Copper resistance protein CopC n=1 Tax=Allocatelliglobosispora scoriae TaxID=643052 RepID=A0A841C0X3_9ACTN|nr:hypothetical protein [Allocatelliglobosispora scoriae]MBB5874024.1 hypothetical protein [Allocatelliglobosispora scoriae]